MKIQYLSLKNVIIGTVLGVLQDITKTPIDQYNIKGYKLIKGIRTQSANEPNNIGIYCDKNNSKTFIKGLFFKYKNLSYHQLLNESSIMHLMNSKLSHKIYSKYLVRFPKLIRLIHNQNDISLVAECINGEPLETYSEDKKIEVIKKCLITLKEISVKLNEKDLNVLPKRSNFHIFNSFSLLFLTTLFKEKNKFLQHSYLFFLFYTKFPYKSLFNTQYELVHKDLDHQNIIINKNEIIMIDTEVTTLAEENTEIAILSRFYYKHISDAKIITLVKEIANTDFDRNRFIAFTIYYSYQMMFIEKNNTKYYNHAKSYLDFISNKLIPSLLVKKSIVEGIYLLCLLLINKLLENISEASPKHQTFILCYHSLGDDDWRFTTPVSNFIEQIQFLKKNFKIMPLNKLITSKTRNAVSITFDDGYSSVYQYAFPILKALHLTATVFIIGNNTKADRRELDNDLPLLTKKQIKELVKNGWEIGYHTHTHSNLSSLTKKQLIHEIKTSKKKVEKELGIQLSYFAYPRGYYNNEIVAIVNEAGYKAAFTVNGGISHHNNLLISRVSMEGKIDLVHFEGLTSKIGLYFSALFMKLLSIKQKYFSINIVSTT